ncbi:MAG: glycosyltransferase family 9 protein [Chitinophagaceae bacterium]|nr:glycosyltransferase family 9 protein [Chitinophagaceae bacterium]
MSHQNRTFIISRVDAIGDVVLTLPVAGVLKELYPGSRILFLGSNYAQEVIRACEYVDEFLNWDELKKMEEAAQIKALTSTGADTIIHVLPMIEIAELAKKADIPFRIGTTNRAYHWYTCNKLVRLSRKRSPYHEAQLNLRLLSVLGARPLYSLKEIPRYYGLTRLVSLPPDLAALKDEQKFNLILHPKSRGHGREWGLDNFIRLANSLPAGQFKLFVTGTPAEKEALEPLFRECPQVVDMVGKLTLPQFMAFIARADGLLASGTGPLHVAAALGIHALGLFPPLRPIHPERWAPLGPKAMVFCLELPCKGCPGIHDCVCMQNISPVKLKEYLLSISIRR